MARNEPQVNLRMPADLKDRLEQASAENNRSLTAEVVSRLEMSFSKPQVMDLPERRKLELVYSYVLWCQATAHDPRESFGEFKVAYEQDETNEVTEGVIGVDEVPRHYLKELYLTWIMERPERFPELADKVRAVGSTTQISEVRADQEKLLERINGLLTVNYDRLMEELQTELEKRLGKKD